jgi:DNA-binding NarL/FixJ family response regulator
MSVLLVTRDKELEERCRRAVSAEYQFETADSVAMLLKAAKPAVALLDALALEKPLGQQVENLMTALATSRVIVMTAEFNEDEEILLLKAGVKGVCRRGVDPESLRQVLSATEGGVWVSRSLLPRLVTELRRYADAHRPPSPAGSARPPRMTVGKLPPEKFESLTRREQEIIRLIADGASNKKAGEDLEISERTVKGHLSNIFQKLDVPDRMKLMLYLRDGKVEP